VYRSDITREVQFLLQTQHIRTHQNSVIKATEYSTMCSLNSNAHASIHSFCHWTSATATLSNDAMHKHIFAVGRCSSVRHAHVLYPGPQCSSFLELLLFIHTPFVTELSSRPPVLFIFGVPSIHTHTLCRRTTKSDVVTHEETSTYLGVSHASHPKTAEFQVSPFFWCSPAFMLLMQNDQLTYGEERVN